MNKAEKVTEVASLKEQISNSKLTIVTTYEGITVEGFNSLRRKLEAGNSNIKVIKNRLAKIAVKGTEYESLSEHFVGATAITTSSVDPVSPAKILIEFTKGNEKVKLKAANMNGQTLTIKQVEALAKLPSREELLGKLLGSMMAPARNLVTVLAQIPRQVVNVLAAVRDQKEKQG